MNKKRKVLILRLSSLGDVILASSVLQVRRLADDELHWATSREYASLIEGHPRVHRVWSVDRRAGLAGWIRICRDFYSEGFDQVLDLHGTIRTRLARVLFWYWSLTSARSQVRWLGIRKPRLKLAGYYLLKSYWPKDFRPTPWVERYTRFVGGDGTERPDLRHLVTNLDSEKFPFLGQPFFCVIPASRWKGKEWPVSSYLEVCVQSKILPVILGDQMDQASYALVEELRRADHSHVSGVGIWDLKQVASVLARARVLVGNDTGIAHLAEAIHSPVLMLFGPTAPEMGFGPWFPRSRSLESPVGCRPCGKDGRYCYRFQHRYRCQMDLKPGKVREALSQFE